MKNESKGGVPTCTFGCHFTMDGYGGNPDKLNDKDLVAKALNELPEKMGMEKMTKPVVHYAEPRNMKDSGGYSGFVMIVESHISIHTFPKKRFVSIDAYTCKDEMDKDVLASYFREMFELEDAEIQFFKRGLKFPHKDLV